MKKPLDPLAPLYGPDGYEYEDFAAYICGEKADTWRNDRVASLRRQGLVPEREVRIWIEHHDFGREPCREVDFNLSHASAAEAALHAVQRADRQLSAHLRGGQGAA